MDAAIPDPQEHARAERSAWRYVRWLLVILVVLVAAVVGFNAWVDPYDMTGRHARPVLLAQSSERAVKVELLEALPVMPPIVVLGSSSARRIDPAIIGGSAPTPSFNFAVQNALLVDHRTLGALALDRWVEDGVPGNARLVVAIDPYRSFSDEIELDPANLWVDDLRAELDHRDQAHVALRTWSRYLDWDTTRDSIDVLRDEPATQAVSAAEYLPDGYLRRDPYKLRDGKLPAGTPSGGERLQADADAYRGRVTDTGERSELGRFQRRQLEALLDRATDTGVEVSVVLMPANPSFRAELQDVGYDERLREARRYVRDLAADRGSRVEVFDLSEPGASGIEQRDFQDHVHLNPLGLRKLACEMQSRGVFGEVGVSPVCAPYGADD